MAGGSGGVERRFSILDFGFLIAQPSGTSANASGPSRAAAYLVSALRLQL